ncbi:MAG: heme o synthase [Pseudomonadota bacterium]
MRAALAQLGSVFKLRIGVAITLSALAGLAVTSGPMPEAGRIAVLSLAVLLSSASAGAFNQYFERDLDAGMSRTRRRPFVTGAYRADGRWLAGIFLLLAGAVAMAALALNGLAALYVFLGAFVYGIVYTVWLKRRSALNIVVGGLSGSFAVLAGAAAVDPSLPPQPVPLILALVLFLWTPPHFWSLAAALRDDYARAGVPMLPVVVGPRTTAVAILCHTVALVGLSLLPAAFGMGWIYTLGAASGGAFFLWRSVKLAREPGRAEAMANFHASLAQLGLLLSAALLDRLAITP